MRQDCAAIGGLRHLSVLHTAWYISGVIGVSIDSFTAIRPLHHLLEASVLVMLRCDCIHSGAKHTMPAIPWTHQRERFAPFEHNLPHTDGSNGLHQRCTAAAATPAWLAQVP